MYKKTRSRYTAGSARERKTRRKNFFYEKIIIRYYVPLLYALYTVRAAIMNFDMKRSLVEGLFYIIQSTILYWLHYARIITYTAVLLSMTWILPREFPSAISPLIIVLRVKRARDGSVVCCTMYIIRERKCTSIVIPRPVPRLYV